MPIYRHECSECKLIFEAFRSIRDYDKPEPCQACRSVSPVIPSATFDDGYRFHKHEPGVGNFNTQQIKENAAKK